MSIPSAHSRSTAPRLEAGRIAELVDIRFPQIHAGGRSMLIEEVCHTRARVRMVCDPRHIRPRRAAVPLRLAAHAPSR